ncbi:MAG: hypothetical protein WD941_01550 [Opitutus sp.]
MNPASILNWVGTHQGLMWFAGTASVAIFVASLFIIPSLVVRIRPDYFTHATRPPSPWAGEHRFVRLAIVAGKNLLGVLLMIAGAAMLVLPGQGLLTLLVGFLLLDFPGKYRFEKWLIARPSLLRPINWLRRRRNHPPLQVV